MNKKVKQTKDKKVLPVSLLIVESQTQSIISTGDAHNALHFFPSYFSQPKLFFVHRHYTKTCCVSLDSSFKQLSEDGGRVEIIPEIVVIPTK